MLKSKEEWKAKQTKFSNFFDSEAQVESFIKVIRAKIGEQKYHWNQDNQLMDITHGFHKWGMDGFLKEDDYKKLVSFAGREPEEMFLDKLQKFLVSIASDEARNLLKDLKGRKGCK